jgi:hypothetical protein
MKKALKEKKCKACGGLFVPFASTSVVCSPTCALDHTKQKAKKNFDKRTRKMRMQSRANDRGYQLKAAQTAFNRFIRIRDEAQPCISCGRYHEGKYDAGHYRTTGAHPELRFNELNCFRQCVPCNQHKSGNLIEYRINLLRRIGEQTLEWLEGPHELNHYSVEDLKDIRKKYTRKAKELEERDPFDRWVAPFNEVNIDAVTGSAVEGY